MEPSLVKWSWALRVLRWIDARVFRAWRCSVCGCTDHFACAEGCGWCFAAPEHICTTCALADPSLVEVRARTGLVAAFSLGLRGSQPPVRSAAATLVMVEREHRIAKLERELNHRPTKEVA